VFQGTRKSLFGVIVATALLTSLASAQDDRDRARKAYDRGLVAHKQGKFSVAATEFALADTLAPSPVALRAALDAALSADDPVLGIELLARTKRAASPPDLAASADKARAAFASRTGRVVLSCNEGAPCEGSVDGTALAVGKERIVKVGDHTVRLRASGADESRVVKVSPDDLVELRPSAALGLPSALPSTPPSPFPAVPGVAPSSPSLSADPSAPSPAPASTPRESGPREAHKPLPPLVVVVGAGLTAVVGGVAVWSALDTKSTHDSFVSGLCSSTGSAACDGLASSGSSAQARTNVLLGVTGGLAAGTLVVALVLVDWTGPQKTTAHARLAAGPLVGPGLGGVRLGGSF
jgi:hypothetical protein